MDRFETVAEVWNQQPTSFEGVLGGDSRSERLRQRCIERFVVSFEQDNGCWRYRCWFAAKIGWAAVVAGALEFIGIARGAATVARVLFVIFLAIAATRFLRLLLSVGLAICADIQPAPRLRK
jgi:uncharacterized membrane protein YtjA (UPF0391 family)